jgi:hypothetical protein
MNKKDLIRKAPLLGCVAALAMPSAQAGTVCPTPPSGIGEASTLCLSYEETSLGISSSGLTNALAVPGTYSYSNTLSGGANGGTPITGSPNGYGFYDDYEFSIAGGTADSLTATINLGGVYNISNLDARIYSVAGLTTLPQLGAVAGEIDGTTSGEIVTIGSALLNPGTYVLEIQGNATGALGGTYSGVLQMSAAAVPLPAAWTFLLSGVAGLGLLRRKRR